MSILHSKFGSARERTNREKDSREIDLEQAGTWEKQERNQDKKNIEQTVARLMKDPTGRTLETNIETEATETHLKREEVVTKIKDLYNTVPPNLEVKNSIKQMIKRLRRGKKMNKQKKDPMKKTLEKKVTS